MAIFLKITMQFHEMFHKNSTSKISPTAQYLKIFLIGEKFSGNNNFASEGKRFNWQAFKTMQ